MLTSLKKMYLKLASTTDALELEQASLRLLIGSVFLIYVLFNMAYARDILKGEMVGLYYLVAFLTLAVLVIFSILHSKKKSVTRRLFGAWLDIGGTTLFMSLTSDVGAVLIGIYLWVTFGNGFRFGNKYLYHCQLLSILGFAITLHYSPYWKSHETVGYSLLLMLALIPLYVAQLITRLNEAKHKAELASARAEEASTAKTQFVANMSHEIRTPLNGIIGISTLLKTTPLNKDQKDLLKTLESSSKLLLSLLNNVLDFTKIEERKFTLENVAFSPEDAVYESIEIFRAQAASKNIQLGASVTNTLGTLKGDVFVLRQVLANLLGNAIKFTEAGSVTLSATLLDRTEQTSTVRFEVTDTGVGIPADKQHKVFESFTQADASTTRKFGGSGLGLTIAKHIVEQMGGTLLFHSTEGVGSRFWFELTLENDLPEIIETSQTPNLSAVEETVKTHINPAGVLSILVCEDESTNQKIITRLLTLPGHNVDIVTNGDEMLDSLEQKKYDLVITDLNMAGMSGTDALKLYRFTQPYDKDTRFILFTADATLSAREAASDAGFDAFLTKPIDALTLFNTIEKILGLAPETAATWMNGALKSPSDAEFDWSEDNVALDIKTLRGLERIGGNDDLFMHRLLKNYLADSLKMIYRIEDAVKQKHFGDVQDFCHALKGNSLSVGALQLATTTENIGKLSSTVPANQALELLNELNTNFSKLTLAVEDYLKRPEAVSRI